MFKDDFDGGELDRAVWLPHYLPAWSSKEATRAEYRLQDSSLELAISPGHSLWCDDEHPEPLRVSGMQSGNHSGPVGSRIGQQGFRDDLLVREEQERFEGWLPSSGRVAVRCRMSLSSRSMAAMWLAGFEENPEDGGELCVVEVFGRSIKDGSAEVGVGVKRVNDPRLTHDFVAPRLAIDVADFHTYAVEWHDEQAVFSVDGEQVHVCADPPTYPMQVMLAVFDFPGWNGRDDHVPSLTVDWVEGST